MYMYEMAKKVIQTILNKEEYQIFEQYKISNNCKSNYEALKHMVKTIPQFEQPTTDQVILTGNVDEDKKKLDSLDRPTLEEFLKRLESKNRKEKNTIKRTGAFHNLNFRDDLDSLLAGEVDLYEVKYHVDWWYSINQVSTALSRKGVNSSLIQGYKNADKYQKPTARRKSTQLQNKVFH